VSEPHLDSQRSAVLSMDVQMPGMRQSFSLNSSSRNSAASRSRSRSQNGEGSSELNICATLRTWMLTLAALAVRVP
jgi:hypothetical protein